MHRTFFAPLSLCVVLAATLTAAAPGCASAQRRFETALALERTPDDFRLAITVVPPDVKKDVKKEEEEKIPRELRGGVYVLLPDAVLRVDESSTDPERLPPIRRQLSREQRRQVWLAVRDSGLLDPEHPGRVGNAGMARRLVDEEMYQLPLYIVEYTVAGRTRAVAVEGGTPPGEAAARLADMLAELGWVE